MPNNESWSMKIRPFNPRISIDYSPMESLWADIYYMSQESDDFRYSLVETLGITNFSLLSNFHKKDIPVTGEGLTHRIICYLSIKMLDSRQRYSFHRKCNPAYSKCSIKIINTLNHSYLKTKRQIHMIEKHNYKTSKENISKWPLFAAWTVYVMNTFASMLLDGFLPYGLVIVRNPPDLTSMTFMLLN